ncbi:DUF5988 family protein [Streptomyces sp. NPDC088789]|uniref:DUF5988 family protein n=1 Tax=Streptomyces sp. NPDC088789 TaxID=3365899 RepID=UPI0038222A39
MRRVAHDPSIDAMDSVHLEGGPEALTGAVELTGLKEVIITERKLKIRYGNGYEHFEPVDAPQQSDIGSNEEPVRFRWVGRTKIAE